MDFNNPRGIQANTRSNPQKSHPRNITGSILTTLAGLFAFIAVLPLVLVLGYVLYKRSKQTEL